MINIFIIIVCSLLIVTGLIAIILPFLPDIPLVFLGVLIYSITTSFAKISLATVVFLAILTLVSLVLSYLAGFFGAKKLGASKYGLWGSFIGLLIGLIFSPLGLVSIFLGPPLGVIVGELIAGKKTLASVKIGLGALLGYLVSVTINFIIAGWMIFIFLKAIL